MILQISGVRTGTQLAQHWVPRPLSFSVTLPTSMASWAMAAQDPQTSRACGLGKLGALLLEC